MWKSPIGFGNFSLVYLYIIGVAVTKIIEDYLISLEDIKSTLKYNMFHIPTVLKSHKLIRVLCRYISFIIFGLIFFEIADSKKNNKKKEIEEDLHPHNKLIVRKYTTTKKTFIELLIVSAFFTFIKILRKIVGYYKVSELDFWIVNIIFVSYYMNKYFGNNILKHQKYSLYFIFLTNIGLLFAAASVSKNKERETIYKRLGWKCILVLIGYIILSWVSSLTKVYSKKLMDYNYISPYRIIFFMGLFGTFFTLITLIFTSSISCGKSTESYCKIKKTSNNKTNYYLDSIPIYFTNLNDVYKKRNFKEFYVEIFIVTPLFSIFNFIEFAFTMLLILYLNPNYILISDCIYFATVKFIEYAIKGDYSTTKFCLEYIAELLALFAYAFFLEIIELRFCGLDNDIKKNIIKRGIRDSKLKETDLDLDLNITQTVEESKYDINETIDSNKNSLNDIELEGISLHNF